MAKPADSATVIDELTQSLRATAAEVVPWFIDSMPVMYFQDTKPQERLNHIRAIIAARASNRPVEMVLRDDAHGQWTFMAPRNYPGVLAEQLNALPDDMPLRSAKIHAARDGDLLIVTFSFGQSRPFDLKAPGAAEKVAQIRDYVAKNAPDIAPDEVDRHLERCSAGYVETLTPLRFAAQWHYFKQVSGTEKAAVFLEEEKDPGYSRIIVTVANAHPNRMFKRITGRLGRAGIMVDRAYLDVVKDEPNGKVYMMSLVCQGPDGGPIDRHSEPWISLMKDLNRVKWIDTKTLELAYRHEGLSLTRAEVVMSLCHLAHHILVKKNPSAFDRDRILKHAERNFSHTAEIVDLFLLRFNPQRPLSDSEFEEALDRLAGRIDREVDLEGGRTVLHTMLTILKGVLRTNVFLRSRFSLAMRIDPSLLACDERPELPYGVFFVHGRSFNGFHVRFRDIARGGVRAVRTIGWDQHAREVDRLYDEVYGLAFAQQLKNKDIPEGGAKAVVLLEPDTPVDRCVKAFVDGLLDLLVAETRDKVIDHFGRPELLYLGPDENIAPDMIEWIVDHAQKRGYPCATAFMSSKPGAGINHKTYGVTSEGVTVFLDTALRSRGIDPKKQRFTVKITGGPDGDVAGNEIRILDRDYGANAVILGIADGSGCGEDPDGLDHQELLRLFREGLPIASFDRSKLGPKGRVVTVEEPEGAQLRNTMHNRIVSDAFVPAGGRPATIHGNNWREFLQPDGSPASKIIVEGANLFLTPEARLRLGEHGVVIIKDSSANKCGVITSSYEIAACMMLEVDEFLAIKETFVDQVLNKLRILARREAELLMRMHRHQPETPLYELSIRLSRVVIRTADAIHGTIARLEEQDEDLIHRLVIEHLPPILIEKAGDRLWKKTPRNYLEWIMAKSMAARLVYREGFEFLESMSEQALAKLALDYLRLETERRRLAAEVAESELPHRDRIARLLEQAGILSTLGEA
ncbi:MAG: NAD-glutamate dehydrogenase [Planctomycetes bacterium]|nr:NAD-glutamate dehydrogenase [Planctomycetota bacterium]